MKIMKTHLASFMRISVSVVAMPLPGHSLFICFKVDSICAEHLQVVLYCPVKRCSF